VQQDGKQTTGVQSSSPATTASTSVMRDGKQTTGVQSSSPVTTASTSVMQDGKQTTGVQSSSQAATASTSVMHDGKQTTGVQSSSRATTASTSVMQDGKQTTGVQNSSQPTTEEELLDVDDQKFQWVRVAVRMLMQLWHEHQDQFTSPKTKKKAVWIKIAKALSDAGYKVTGAQAESKWKNITKKYRDMVDQKNIGTWWTIITQVEMREKHVRFMMNFQKYMAISLMLTPLPLQVRCLLLKIPREKGNMKMRFRNVIQMMNRGFQVLLMQKL
jgi:hypothetical protein